MDFSWDSESDLGFETVPLEVWAQRFAITAPQCVVRANESLLVVDPHPEGTWKNWMFPYASLVLSDAELLDQYAKIGLTCPSLEWHEGRTFNDLSALLTQVRNDLADAYSQAIREEVNNVLPGIGPAWKGAPFYENFSLKFSKTSNSFTAYVFQYFRNDVDELHVELPALWVPIDEILDTLSASAEIDGRTVSSNVSDAASAISRALSL